MHQWIDPSPVDEPMPPAEKQPRAIDARPQWIEPDTMHQWVGPDPFAQNATLSQATINGNPHWEDLSGLAPAAINYYDYDVSSVAILINSSSSVDVQDNGGIYTTVNGQQV